MPLNKFLSKVKNASKIKESTVTSKATKRKTESEVCSKKKILKLTNIFKSYQNIINVYTATPISLNFFTSISI